MIHGDEFSIIEDGLYRAISRIVEEYQRYVHRYAFGKHKKDKFSSRLSFVQFDNQNDSDCDNSDRWMKVIMVENWKLSE